MLKLNRNLLKGRWIKHKDTDSEFKITPVDGSVLEEKSTMLYEHIIDWRNVFDHKENELVFSLENAKFLVLNCPEIGEWLLEEVKAISAELVSVLKN